MRFNLSTLLAIFAYLSLVAAASFILQTQILRELIFGLVIASFLMGIACFWTMNPGPKRSFLLVYGATGLGLLILSANHVVETPYWPYAIARMLVNVKSASVSTADYNNLISEIGYFVFVINVQVMSAIAGCFAGWQTEK